MLNLEPKVKPCIISVTSRGHSKVPIPESKMEKTFWHYGGVAAAGPHRIKSRLGLRQSCIASQSAGVRKAYCFGLGELRKGAAGSHKLR